MSKYFDYVTAIGSFVIVFLIVFIFLIISVYFANALDQDSFCEKRLGMNLSLVGDLNECKSFWEKVNNNSISFINNTFNTTFNYTYYNTTIVNNSFLTIINESYYFNQTFIENYSYFITQYYDNATKYDIWSSSNLEKLRMDYAHAESMRKLDNERPLPNVTPVSVSDIVNSPELSNLIDSRIGQFKLEQELASNVSSGVNRVNSVNKLPRGLLLILLFLVLCGVVFWFSQRKRKPVVSGLKPLTVPFESFSSRKARDSVSGVDSDVSSVDSVGGVDSSASVGDGLGK